MFGPADERADVVSVRAQCVDHLRPDESRASGDEDLHDPKFFQ
jgi:hypothetical protein